MICSLLTWPLQLGSMCKQGHDKLAGLLQTYCVQLKRIQWRFDCNKAAGVPTSKVNIKLSRMCSLQQQSVSRQLARVSATHAAGLCCQSLLAQPPGHGHASEETRSGWLGPLHPALELLSSSMPACMQNKPDFWVQNNSQFTFTAALACPGVGFCVSSWRKSLV